MVPQHFRTNKKIWQETDSSLRVYEEQLEKETSMAMISSMAMELKKTLGFFFFLVNQTTGQKDLHPIPKYLDQGWEVSLKKETAVC